MSICLKTRKTSRLRKKKLKSRNSQSKKHGSLIITPRCRISLIRFKTCTNLPIIIITRLAAFKITRYKELKTIQILITFTGLLINSMPMEVRTIIIIIVIKVLKRDKRRWVQHISKITMASLITTSVILNQTIIFRII